MKKPFLLSIIISAGVLFLLSNAASADTYRSPYYPYEKGYKAGDCIMVDDRSEADATHVYTLNPSHTVNLNNSYYLYWNRNARCDELQFHVDHNTSDKKLRAWLGKKSVAWFKNLKVSPLEGTTISQGTGWFLIKDGKTRKIPDWLTGLSWGLVIWDKRTIGEPLRAAFTQYVKSGAPLDFNDGPNADKIRTIWKDGDRDFSLLPERLASEITNSLTFFTECRANLGHGDPRDRPLNWDWMLRNPGCPLEGE